MNILDMEIDMYLLSLKHKFKTRIDYDKYYLAYSGGKDSHFLYWFIKEYLKDDKIKIVSVNTFMEHQEIRERMYKNADIVLTPKMKPMEIKVKYGIPCFSKHQDDFIDRYQRGSRAKSTMEIVEGNGKNGDGSFKLNKKAKELLLSNNLHKISSKCCTYLKKNPFKDYEKETGLKPITGVRGQESIRRKSQYTQCLNLNGTFTPLFDLDDILLDKIYKKYNIEIPEVYNHISRTGCMGCPYGSYKGNTDIELKLITPQQKKFVCEYFKESYDVLDINKIKGGDKNE